MDSSTKRRAVTPEHVVKTLEKHGIKIGVEEAKIILDFLYKFGKLTLNQAFNR